MKLIKILAAALSTSLLMGAAHTWYQVDGYWHYTGAAPASTARVNGFTYSFDDEGRMQTGWVEGRFFDKEGRLITSSWFEDSGDWYYADAGGNILKGGRSKVEGEWYNFDDEGAALQGWDKNHSSYYDWAAPISAWLNIDDEWYYFDKEGRTIKGRTAKIGKDHYYFDDEGRMQTGFIETEEGLRYFYEDGRQARAATINTDEGRFYFKANGTPAYGTINGRTYYAGRLLCAPQGDKYGVVSNGEVLPYDAAAPGMKSI